MASDPLVLRVLHIDDNVYDLQHVKKVLETEAVDCRFVVLSFTKPEDLLAAAKDQAPDLVLVDIHLNDDASTEGISLAERVRQMHPEAVVVMRSNADEAATIARCLKGGADDFISKRTDHGELCLRLLNSYRLARLKSGRPTAPSGPASRGAFPQVVGETLRTIAHSVPHILDSAISAVHVFGETGTGKEVVADLFEAHLPKSVPFVRVHCGAIAPTLMESELFGHVKGAFTGAHADKIGLFERASGGWIFLDEIATLRPATQVALLRVIENQEIMRVGDTRTRKINVRILSATNEDLDQKVVAGEFRKDLLQRIREKQINLPPLRERKGEIPQLIEHFCKTMAGGPYEVSPSVIDVLSAVSWREGNVRELRNCLKAMTEFNANRTLTPIAIPARIWEELDREERDEIKAAKDTEDATPPVGKGRIVIEYDEASGFSFDELTDQLLLQLVRSAFERHPKLSMRKLSAAVGMPRTTLSERLRRLVSRGLVSKDELATLKV